MPKTNSHINANAAVLSMLILQDGLSFLVYEPTDKQVTKLKHFTFEKGLPTDQLHESIKSRLSETGILDLSFSSVFVCVSNSLSAFVPNAHFDNSQMERYLKHHVDVHPTDFITHDQLENLEVTNVYVPFVNVNNMLLDAFGRFSYFHASSVLAKTYVQKIKDSNKRLWGLHIESGIAYSMVFKNGKLIFYNTFSWINEEDLLYYTLAVRKNHKLSKSVLWLSGKTSKDDSFQKLLYDYHQETEVVLPSDHVNHKNLNLLHPHHHLLLLETSSCAS